MDLLDDATFYTLLFKIVKHEIIDKHEIEWNGRVGCRNRFWKYQLCPHGYSSTKWFLPNRWLGHDHHVAIVLGYLLFTSHYGADKRKASFDYDNVLISCVPPYSILLIYSSLPILIYNFVLLSHLLYHSML